jgi:hypothetical protein
MHTYFLAKPTFRRRKNAFRENDPAEPVRWARKALDAAHEAARLAPEDNVVRGFVLDCRNRLNKVEPDGANATVSKGR